MFVNLVNTILRCICSFFMADYEKFKFKIDDDDEKRSMRNDSYYINIRDSFEYVLTSD